jgi:hypothetical protein
MMMRPNCEMKTPSLCPSIHGQIPLGFFERKPLKWGICSRCKKNPWIRFTSIFRRMWYWMTDYTPEKALNDRGHKLGEKNGI